MTNQEILDILCYTMPLYTALICGMLLVKHYRNGELLQSRVLMRTAIRAYAATIVACLSVIVYIGMPQLYIVFNAAVMWMLLGGTVLYYRIFFELTKTDPSEKFSMLHFAFPTVITVVLLVWSFFVPRDVQLQLIESRGTWRVDYPIYSLLSSSKVVLFSIIYLLYNLSGLRRAARFQRAVVNYSADEQRSSLQWVHQIFFILLGSFPLAVALVLFTRHQLISFPLIVLPMLVLMFKNVILAHNLLTGNFVIIDAEPYEGEGALHALTPADVSRLETYMRRNKPYLNPKLKITDMAYALHTNRSSLSLLINRTYGMNFCRFVNRYRIQELEQLQNNPKNALASELDLVAKAGFSDWRGYIRVKEREENPLY